MIEKQADTGIADGDLAHAFDDQLTPLTMVRAGQNFPQPASFRGTIDAADLPGNVVGQQVAADCFYRCGGEPIRWRSAFPDRLGMGDIITEPLSVAHGVNRTHGSPVAIDDQSLEQAARD